MSAAYVRYVSLLFSLLLLLAKCHAWRDHQAKNKKLLMDLSDKLVTDLARKGETVWNYRKVFAQYVSFAIGERVYLIRARFAAMMRTYLRNQLHRRTYSVDQLLRNALLLQKRTQGIYIMNDDLTDLDLKVNSEYNPYNTTRFGKHACQVAGSPCNIVPIREGYRRQLGAMDEALKLIDARRKFIKQKYQPEKTLSPIDIDAEINRSLNIKFSTLSRPKNRDVKMDFINLAPDFF